MRRTGEPSTWVVLALVVGLAGCDKKPTTPDPNAAMYGSWVGRLTETTQTAAGPELRYYALDLLIGSGGIEVRIDGTPRASTIDAIRDPELRFTIANGALRVTHAATRSGRTLIGEAVWPGAQVHDDWFATRPPMVAPTSGRP